MMAGFEGGLCLVAHVLGLLTGYSPWKTFHSHPDGILAALGLTAVLFGLFTAIYARPFGPFRGIHQLLTERAGPIFSGMGLFHFAVIAGLAGVGEEALFRGWLQGWMQLHWGTGPAVMISSLLFGLAHPLSLSYLLSTLAIGLALTGLYQYSGGWLAPALTHGLYDFLALAWFFRKKC